jgi:hypothetical protein
VLESRGGDLPVAPAEADHGEVAEDVGRLRVEFDRLVHERPRLLGLALEMTESRQG